MSETLVSHSAFPTSFPVRGNAGGSADVDSSEEEVGMNARRTLPAQPTYGCKPIYDPKALFRHNAGMGGPWARVRLRTYPRWKEGRERCCGGSGFSSVSGRVKGGMRHTGCDDMGHPTVRIRCFTVIAVLTVPNKHKVGRTIQKVSRGPEHSVCLLLLHKEGPGH